MENLFLLLTNYGWIGIAIAALLEAIFLPIPMDSISIPIYLLNKEKAILYSIILIIFSILGSALGYFIGRGIGKNILLKFISEKMLQKIEKLYNENTSLAIISSAFTPIPYEAYVLSAGVFNIKFSQFIFYALISRIIRHLSQGVLIQFFGEQILSLLKNYSIIIFSLFSLAIILKLALKKLKSCKVENIIK